MSGLLSSLRNGAAAINANEYAIQIAGQNLQRANDTSYAKQSVNISSMGVVKIGDLVQSLGTEVSSVSNARNSILDYQILRNNMLSGFYGSQQNFGKNLELALGEKLTSTEEVAGAGTSGLSKIISNFFNEAGKLSANASDMSQRSVFLGEASNLVNQLHAISERLETVSTDIDVQITDDSQDVNTLLEQISAYNKQIQQFELNSKGGALDLRDARQKTLEELSKYVDFRVDTAQNGTIKLISKDQNGADVVFLDNQTVNGTFSFDSSNDQFLFDSVVLNMQKGSLAGTLSIKTNQLNSMQTSLNKLTENVVSSVNKAYNPTRTTGPLDEDMDFFDATKTTMDTIALKVNSSTFRTSSDSTSPNFNDLIQKISDVSKETMSGLDNKTVEQFYTQKVTSLGADLKNINNNVDNQSTVNEMLENRRQGTIGVSMDQEITDLMSLQKAYQASAKFISMINEMLSILVNL